METSQNAEAMQMFHVKNINLLCFNENTPVTIFGLYIGMYAPRIVALKTFYLMNISFRPLHLVSTFISGNILQRSYGELVI